MAIDQLPPPASTAFRIVRPPTPAPSSTARCSWRPESQARRQSDHGPAGIFGWDVDFALDIREGDRFTVLYEQLYLDGERIGDGHIIAAEFVNQGRAYQAAVYRCGGPYRLLHPGRP